MAYKGNSPCPRTIFYINALNHMDTLHEETCPPQTKITKFINAARCHFASPDRNPTRGKKSKKQAKKMVQNPHKKQPCHTVNGSKQKNTVNNRQSSQPVATSCKDRSPTPHPHNRGKADTKQSHQPTSTSCRTRNPAPQPCEHGNTFDRTFSESIYTSLQKDNNSFQIGTMQLHQNSPHSTENSSLQDHFRCIARPSTSNHVKKSCIPILSKLVPKCYQKQ